MFADPWRVTEVCVCVCARRASSVCWWRWSPARLCLCSGIFRTLRWWICVWVSSESSSRSRWRVWVVLTWCSGLRSPRLTCVSDSVPQEVPDPLRFLVTRWSTDPWAQMSYSFVKTGGSGEAYDIIAEDVQGKLFFAGEVIDSDTLQSFQLGFILSAIFNLSFSLSPVLNVLVSFCHMCPWSTKAVISSTAIFVAITNNTLYGSKLYIFLLCQKSLDIKITIREDITYRKYIKT